MEKILLIAMVIIGTIITMISKIVMEKLLIAMVIIGVIMIMISKIIEIIEKIYKKQQGEKL